MGAQNDFMQVPGVKDYNIPFEQVKDKDGQNANPHPRAAKQQLRKAPRRQEVNEAGEIIDQRGGANQRTNPQTVDASAASVQNNTPHHQIGQHTVQVHSGSVPREEGHSSTETITTAAQAMIPEASTTTTSAVATTVPTPGATPTALATTQNTASAVTTSTTTSVLTLIPPQPPNL